MLAQIEKVLNYLKNWGLVKRKIHSMTWNSYVYLICCRIQTKRGQQQLSFFVSWNVHQVALKVHISLLSRYANVIVVAWNFKKFEILRIAVTADVVLIRVNCILIAFCKKKITWINCRLTSEDWNNNKHFCGTSFR